MTSSAKTYPYTPNESDGQPGAYAVATPAPSFTASSQPVSATPRSSVNTATVSQPPQPAVYAESLKHAEPPQMIDGNKYVFIDSRKPVTLTYCPRCYQEHVTTSTRTKANGTTALCVVAGVVIFWPLCWLPLCIREMKQTNHYCTKCGCKVGRVKPFQ
jgi:LITAF-like zinc ribbon domain